MPAPPVAAPAAAGTLGGTIAGTSITYGNVLTVAGALSSAAGMISAGNQAKAAAQGQAEIYRRQADRERQIGSLNAKRIRDQGKKNQGTLTALLGDRANTGQGLLIGENLVEEAEFNARLAENNAEAAISQKNAERVQVLAAGKDAQMAGLIRGGTTLLKVGKEFS